jgi:hypothetical protein
MDQLENFLRNREDVYLGSTRHFFNALIHNRLKQEGFKLYRVSASANESWPRKFVKPFQGVSALRGPWRDPEK